MNGTRSLAWHVPAVFAWRVVCFYLSFVCLPMLLGLVASLIPAFGESFQTYVGNVYDAIDSWVAVHLFHLSGPVTKPHPTGSGDTTLQYVDTSLWVMVAVVLALAWSSVGWLRRSEQSVYPWVRLVVRFYLAYILLSYGFGKVYPNQFPGPDLSRLTETYGESSPMGLMWTFMGSSTAYEIFCGSTEALAGMLLLFRRTSTVGAMLGGAVMFHIFILNLCFDVPVKLFSLSLFLMAIFLLKDDMTQLWKFLVLRQAAQLEGAWIPKFEKRWLHYSRLGLQVLVPLWFAFQIIPAERSRYVAGLENTTKVRPFGGIWEADEPAVQGPAWRRMVLDGGRRVATWTREGALLRFNMKLDTAAHKLTLEGWRNDHDCDFSYEGPDAGRLVLKGRIDKTPVEMKFHRVPTPAFLLLSRRFRWISEDPYNM